MHVDSLVFVVIVGWAELPLQPEAETTAVGWAELSFSRPLSLSLSLGWAGRHLRPEAGRTACGWAGPVFLLMLSLLSQARPSVMDGVG